jgi:hypothetical protein
MGLRRECDGADLDSLTYFGYVKRMRTTVRLPDDLMIAAKAKARRQGATLTKVIEDGVRAFVAEPSPNKIHKWTMPPISSVGGKCLVDLTRMSDVYDVLDEGLPLEKLR